MIAVYWGRFNPPHTGHMQMIKKILREVDFLIIAVGSAQEKNTKRNPFSGLERKKMMEAYLKENQIGQDRAKVIPVRDGKSFSSSITNLFDKCKPFDVLYTDKQSIIGLIKKKIRIKRITRKGTISSTKIRYAIAKNNDWEHLTGIMVAYLVKQLKGEARIKKAYEFN